MGRVFEVNDYAAVKLLLIDNKVSYLINHFYL